MSADVFTPAQIDAIKAIVRELLTEPSGYASRPGTSVEQQDLSASLADEGYLKAERASYLVKPPIVMDER